MVSLYYQRPLRVEVKVLNTTSKKLVNAEIVPAVLSDMPYEKDGWNFNWRTLFNDQNTRTYVLRRKHTADQIDGVLQLRVVHGMMLMNNIELSPDNIGTTKKHDFVAGCLIAYACRESFSLDGDYKGFLVFESKTELIDHYTYKYGAALIRGQRMFIGAQQGIRLIEYYLNNV